MPRLAIADVNRLSPAEFVATFGAVFEHAPWVAERVASRRPFADREALHRAMLDIVGAASRAEQDALLRGHPELGEKALLSGGLTASSQSEQTGAGLDRLTGEEAARLARLNRDYQARFGFPFILAVRGLGKDDILAAFEARLARSPEEERRTAFGQIARITGFRLAALFD